MDGMDGFDYVAVPTARSLRPVIPGLKLGPSWRFFVLVLEEIPGY
jgi:hypothetical protein